jgi:hypothetical protein
MGAPPKPLLVSTLMPPGYVLPPGVQTLLLAGPAHCASAADRPASNAAAAATANETLESNADRRSQYRPE